jgi:hypothetical protein
MTRMYFWYLLRSPRPVFEELYGWKPWTAYGYIFSSILKNMRLARRRSRGYIRDVFKAWNREWTEPEHLPRSAAPDTRAPAPRVQVSSAGK